MKKIQKGDMVIVTAGKHAWAVATVKHIADDRIWLTWVNIVKKAVKKQGFVEKEASLHISNVSAYDEEKKVATRVKIGDHKGKKVRVYASSGKTITTASK